MAMFRGLVPASQPREEEASEVFTCPICLDIYRKPILLPCNHTFCEECLNPYLALAAPVCALCRSAFDPQCLQRATALEKHLNTTKAPCQACGKKIVLAKLRSHTASCTHLQHELHTCPPFTPIAPTSQNPPNMTNRLTFVCPYCGLRNLDQPGMVRHCTDQHRDDPSRVVCPVCVAMPWGDPNYRSSNFIQHLVHRHKFSYDTFVDYTIDEEATLQAVLERSLCDK
uniref:E3 ubiquitin-protein ligase RNF166 n=1 Tax=Myxine glutinosa TaxID=7769 RepID=UPI00359015EC